MSEKRRKSHAVLLKIQGKSSRVELFPAEEWTGTEAGLWRVRIDGRWHVPAGGGHHEFLNPEGVAALLAGLLFGDAPAQAGPGKAWEAAGRGIRRVRAPLRYEGDVVTATQIAAVLAPPIQAIDGRFWLPVMGYDGRGYALLEDCEVL
ncbi:hypothetical protein G3N56_06090 [Desulfovibrio sulfodismutans]|uniref:Uncharacterized protein n=1 Tax=Desulfolutivibrio sulfodismutans TaxID=63561 RepID=A0A7K3NJE0_9BACT|nr:hypothetical protein [Desulfolutivibrio sulfodismutans]NDY56312.1 hypothetical protein [Desulfolutivibrio sulfodismutans]QLA11497.1 hypothetical protein GD606_04010 [Desulfolutivibrio sulfodismutans DSM 3696]QLA14203.1 hypothetical protein GD606_18985 [Desulfolutivibrio sulfodismutans DSM 3696]